MIVIFLFILFASHFSDGSIRSYIGDKIMSKMGLVPTDTTWKTTPFYVQGIYKHDGVIACQRQKIRGKITVTHKGYESCKQYCTKVYEDIEGKILGIVKDVSLMVDPKHAPKDNVRFVFTGKVFYECSMNHSSNNMECKCPKKFSMLVPKEVNQRIKTIVRDNKFTRGEESNEVSLYSYLKQPHVALVFFVWVLSSILAPPALVYVLTKDAPLIVLLILFPDMRQTLLSHVFPSS